MALDACTIRRLRATDRPSAPFFHAVRLATKRQRSWWRLARPMISRTALRRAESRLAGAAQVAAPYWEARVLQRLLARVAHRLTGDGAAPGRSPSAFPDQKISAARFGRIRRELLRAFQSDVAAWRRLPTGAVADERLLRQLNRSYRRTRRRGRRAWRRGRSRDVHTWRKWVKAHQAQLEFLNQERSGRLTNDLDRFARLGRLLGRVRDLTELADRLDRGEFEGVLTAADIRRLRAVIADWRVDLQTRCDRLGGRLLQLKPKAYARHLREATVPRATRARTATPRAPDGPA